MGKLHSRREDVTLANPYGPPVRGLEQVLKAEEHAASGRRDGKTIGFEIVSKYVTAELAYVVQLEHLEAKVGGREGSPPTTATTMIFRPEDGVRVVHRHADPIRRSPVIRYPGVCLLSP